MKRQEQPKNLDELREKCRKAVREAYEDEIRS